MAAYLFEPPVASTPTPTYDYGSVYGNISTYLNQVRQELASIDTDTTASAATLALIATSLATMAANSTTIATKVTDIASHTASIKTSQETIAEKQTTIAEKQTTIAAKQTAMETYQKRLKELGEGRGIHVIGPYEWIGLLSIYRLLIEQGKILDDTDKVSQEKINLGLARARDFLNKFNDLPTNF